MITNLPVYVYVVFFAALIYSVEMFYFASGKNNKVFASILLWGLFNSILAYSGFYENTHSIPPRLLLLVLPIPLIIMLFNSSKKVKNWMASLHLKRLTWLHIVRFPVELVLFWLFTAGYVPKLMTFEGANFDILAGFFAAIVALIAFTGNSIYKPLLWIWNTLSIILLANILINATLSSPTAFQQFAFEQPNIAILKFPFVLLPGIIVPLVLISNISGFIILKREK